MATATLTIYPRVEGAVTVREEDEEMPVAGMPVYEVPKDSTGSLLRVELRDADGTVADVSGGSAVKFHARTPEGAAVTTDGVAAYTNDGTDGLVEFALTSTEVGTERDLWCEFEVTGLAGGDLISKLFTLRVLPRAKVS